MTAPRFLGRARGGAGCSRCSREVRNLYRIAIDGAEVVMGRRCAARTMGWATTRVEMEAKIAERVAEVTRREAVIGAEFPRLLAAHEAFQAACRAHREAGYDPNGMRQPTEAAVFQTAACTDWMWREDTWRDYITDCLGGAA